MNKQASLAYFGRSSVRVTSAAGFTVYFDPFAPGDYSIPADLVLVTHGHGDHNAVRLVTLKPEGVILAPSGAVSGHPYQTIHEGSEVQVGRVSVRAVAAYNKNHDRASCVGYVVDFGGLVVYHAGDTSYIPEMASLATYGIDYALLPTDGFYNMDGAEAARCAQAVQARVAIAIHSSKDQLFSAANARKLVYAHALAPEPGAILVL